MSPKSHSNDNPENSRSTTVSPKLLLWPKFYFLKISHFIVILENLLENTYWPGPSEE